jgi:hypothetical protein
MTVPEHALSPMELWVGMVVRRRQHTILDLVSQLKKMNSIQ